MYCGRVELYQEEDAKVKGEGEGEFWWRTKVDVASDPERVGGWEVRRVRVLEWEGEGQGEGRRARVMELMPRQDLFADVSYFATFFAVSPPAISFPFREQVVEVLTFCSLYRMGRRRGRCCGGSASSRLLYEPEKDACS